MLFLENSASLLLIVHLVLAIITLVGLIGGFIQIIKKRPDWKKINRFVIIGSLGYLITWILGLLIYPVFRVNVRAVSFDSYLPWATGLFEVKEHVGSIGLIATLALFAFAYYFGKEDSSRTVKLTYAQLITFVLLVTLFKAAAGIILTAKHSI